MTKYQDDEFEILAKDILENEDFKILKKDRHHGSTNKYDHCKRVAETSYKLAGFFNADKKSVVRPALLHDFFYGERTQKPENSYFKHPQTSINNAKYYFNINDEEADIIKTHMFHFLLARKVLPFLDLKENASLKETKPRSKEAWIVCLADLIVSIREFGKYQVNYSVGLMALFIINLLTVNK